MRNAFPFLVLLACLLAPCGNAAERKAERDPEPFPPGRPAKEGAIRKWFLQNNQTEIKPQDRSPFVVNVRWVPCLQEPCHAYPWRLDLGREEIAEEKLTEYFRTLPSNQFKFVTEDPHQDPPKQAHHVKLRYVIGEASPQKEDLRGFRIVNIKDAQYALAFYVLSPEEQTARVTCYVLQDRKAGHKTVLYQEIVAGKGKEIRRSRQPLKVRLGAGINCILLHVTLGSAEPYFAAVGFEAENLYYPVHLKDRGPAENRHDQVEDYNERAGSKVADAKEKRNAS